MRIFLWGVQGCPWTLPQRRKMVCVKQRAAFLLNLDGNTHRASMQDVTQYETLSAERSGELKQIYKTNGHNFDCAQASQTRAHRVPHPSTPAAWQYTETQGLGKHNQERPEPVALELHAKNQTPFSLSTKKTEGKQRPRYRYTAQLTKNITSNSI